MQSSRRRLRLEFTKMHGLGNDFVVVDAREGTRLHEIPREQWPSLARTMCDRHFGVGADQMLLVCEASSPQEFDFMMKLYNVDGFEAEMCGNGVRCIGKFAYEEGICRKEAMLVETLGGVKRLSLQIDPDTDEVNSVAVWMGVPVIEFRDKEVVVRNPERRFQLTAVNMGNPHAVAIVEEDVRSLPLHEIGPEIEHFSSLFPNRTNFELVNVLRNHNIDNSNSESDGVLSLRVRVWERSAGITMACGTGACASVVAAKSKGLIKEDSVEVHLPGGALVIEWDCKGEVVMKGPATKVFDGSWLLKSPFV